MLFGGLILAVILRFRGETVFPGFKQLGWPLLCGFIFALDLYMWHRSVLIVGPGLATLLGNCQVFVVALIAVLVLKEKLSWQRAVSIPAAMAGLYLVLGYSGGAGGDAFRWGVILGLLTAVAYALYILTLRQAQSRHEKLSDMEMLAYISLFAGLMLGGTILFEPESSFTIPDLQSWASLIGLGLLSQVLGWVLISRGLPQVDASLAGLALLLQPALAYIWDVLFFGRVVGGVEMGGIAVTLGAIYLGTLKKRETADVKSET